MGFSTCLGLFVLLHLTLNWRKNYLNTDTDQQLKNDETSTNMKARSPVEFTRFEKGIQLATDEIPLNMEKEKVVTDQEEVVPFSTLLADYHKQLKDLKDGGYWEKSRLQKTCDKVTHHEAPCRETSCKATVAVNPGGSLRSVLRSMKDLDVDTLNEITRLLRAKYTHKKVLFVTAASSNHFAESQALIRNLNEFVWPVLTNYSFVYYDLGLTTYERSQLELFCNCEVRTFPLSTMPRRLQNLKCYTWKPLIVHANLPTADMLVWVDASVRFMNRTVLSLLKHLEEKRLNIRWGGYNIASHTSAAMFDYFGEKTCSFTHIPEIEANFVSFMNDRFIREAIIKPWAACALNPNCMCPDNAKNILRCAVVKIRKYNKCHRFDQSALGIILVKLFRGYEESLKVQRDLVIAWRNQRERYFDKLTEEKNSPLFKNFV